MSLCVWEVYLALFNEVIHLVLVFVEEWRNTYDHLVNKDAKCPPINRVIVSISDQHFWRKILSCATERVCEFPILNKFR